MGRREVSYWNDRTTAFWTSGGKPRRWTPGPIDLDPTGGGVCDACGYEGLVYLFHISDEGGNDRIVGSVCINQVYEATARGSAAREAVAPLKAQVNMLGRSLRHEKARVAAWALSTQLLDHWPEAQMNRRGFPSLGAFMQDMLRKRLPPKADVRWVNARLRERNLRKLQPIGQLVGGAE